MTLTHTTTATTPEGLDRLHDRFDGEIVTSADARYDALRRVWNGSIDRYPAAILRPAHTDDVALAIRFAHERGLVTAIRGGGHSLPGYSSCDGGIVIDLRLMNRIDVDPARREAVAQPGLTWSGFDHATQRYGLATPGGEVSDTGIAGLTLGGGIGWLRRKHGLTCDNLLGVELVTADGEVVHADADHHPDLYWAVRGGGGNFGVVTSFRYRLHPVGRFVGGMVMHPLERGPAALRFLRELAADAPDELSPMAAVITAPPAPFVPEPLRGRPVVVLGAAYFGSVEDGERALEPLRRFGPPTLDALRPMEYVELQSMVDEANPPGMQGYFKSEMLTELTDDVIDTVVAFGETPTSPMAQILLHRLGGVMGRVPRDETAFVHRDGGYMATVAALWPSPDDDAARHVDWTRRLWGTMREASAGTYVNHLGTEGQERVREAYDEHTYARLARVKAAWDPDNFFRLNQNIVPA
jgi:FAD/FMN-containing dehydrogenase